MKRCESIQLLTDRGKQAMRSVHCLHRPGTCAFGGCRRRHVEQQLVQNEAHRRVQCGRLLGELEEKLSDGGVVDARFVRERRIAGPPLPLQMAGACGANGATTSQSKLPS